MPGLSSFDSLAKTRMEWVESSRKNEYDFSELLTGIYENPAHFLYELIQNAEDAKASWVSFELNPDELVVLHDGRRFNLHDVKGITGIGNSPKAEDLTQIGRFGIGFKSVFAITTSPQIHSGTYHLQLNDFVVPVKIPEKEPSDGTTEITLRFNHESRPAKTAYALIRNELASFNVGALLFLYNVKELRWKIGDEAGIWVRREQRTRTVPNAKFVHIENQTGEADRFLRFSQKSVIGDGRLSVSIAYRLTRGGAKAYRVVPERRATTTLSVHFPTTRPTGLRFRINGPFLTTVNRADVPFEDNGENLILLKELAVTVRKSLSGLKAMGYLTPHVFEVLPIEDETSEDPVYTNIRSEVVAALRNDGVLPTRSGGFCKASEAALPLQKELTALLAKTDLKRLFKRKHFLHPQILECENVSFLEDFLTSELGIRKVDAANLLARIDVSLLESKNDTWFVGLYRVLAKQPSLGQSRWPQIQPLLKSKPIIRLESGKHVCPFDSRGNPNAYIPDSENPSDLPTVKDTIASNRSAAVFLLQSLGLRKPDVIAEVEEVILPRIRRRKGLSKKSLSDFHTIVRAFRRSEGKVRDRLRSKLQEVAFVPGEVDGKGALVAPSDAYFRRSDIRAYFGSNSGIAFVSKRVKQSDDVVSLLRGVRVAEFPRRISTPIGIHQHEIKELREGYVQIREDKVENYTLDGLDTFLASPRDLHRSVALWRLLLLGLADSQNYLKGVYRFTPRSNPRVNRFDSEALRKLRSSKWLADRFGNWCKPSDLTVDELAFEYDRGKERVAPLIEALRLNPSVVSRLPKEEQKKHKLTKDYSVSEIEEALQLLEYKRSSADDEEPDEEWAPAVRPGSTGSMRELVPKARKKFKPKLRKGAGGGGGTQRSTRPNKEVGRWGEEHVFELLKVAFPEHEIIWLNEKGDEQSGYDIIVKQAGAVTEYVEVKTTTTEGAAVFPITQPQWDWATDLYDDGNGDKYVIYVVPSAGTQDANPVRIVNPVKLWRDGYLRARPIGIEIPSSW